MAINKTVIRDIEMAQKRPDVPDFKGGDTLRVHVKVIEGGKERIQVFEGVALARRGEGIRDTVLVRKVSNGVGVERTFLVHSPRLDRIEVVRRGRVRRAKLYYLRNLSGKAARIKEDRRSLLAAQEAANAAKVARATGKTTPAEPVTAATSTDTSTGELLANSLTGQQA